MSKRSEKVRKERIKEKREWNFKIVNFVVSTAVAIFAAIPSYFLGRANVNNYYGDVITYQMYGEVAENLNMTMQETDETYNIKVGKSIAVLAIEYCVGKPFAYGGTSLKEGADASGLVLSLYKKYGIDLPHSSKLIAEMGEEVLLVDIRDGDIVCYDGHIGVYVGDGMIVHASNPKTGIALDDMYYREPITIRRFDFAEAQKKNE